MAKTMFAICRLEKRTDIAQIRRSQKHNLRQAPTPNADPNGPPPRLLMGLADLVAGVKALLPDKRRKNAVLAVEMVLTASPEWWAAASDEVKQQWEDANMAWLKDSYGDRMVQVVRHDDEKTPHLHAYWVPLVDGKLNYRAIHGSPRSLIELQDGYGKAMAKFGLSRGQPKSGRRHEHHSKVVDLWSQAQVSMKQTAQALRQLADMMDDLEASAILRKAGASLAEGLGRGAGAAKAATVEGVKKTAPASPKALRPKTWEGPPMSGRVPHAAGRTP